MKDWHSKSQRSGKTLLWRPKQRREPTKGCSAKDGFTRGEATRRLTDLEEQRKRGPKLVKVKVGLEGQLGSTFPRSMGMLTEEEKGMA